MPETTNPAHDHGQALPAGTRIKEFVIERVLGSGGFGITYLARDVRLDRQVVIKENLPVQFCFRDTHSLTVAPRHTTGEDAENFQWSLENFSKEAAMLASLDHPGIVNVLRSFEAFGTAYFVMPFVEGITLDELLVARQAKGPIFSEEELRSMLVGILDALIHLHNCSIYHRDIKPANILITNERLPVLIDFGSARQRLSERSMTVVESAGYTPFEQLQSHGNVGPWSDLYALGATFVKVITGESPPKATDRVKHDPFTPLADREATKGCFSELFLSSVDRALKVEESERWQNASDWISALDSAGKPPDMASGGVTPARKAIQTRSGARLSVVGILVVVSIMAIWWNTRERKNSEAADSPGSKAFSVPTVPSPSKPGLVVISSDPPEAIVKDEKGIKAGITPVEIRNLQEGETWIGTVEKEGYRVESIAVKVAFGAKSFVPTVKLKALPQQVRVETEPVGAEVVEEGKVLGVTPWEGAPREVGSIVRVKLRLAGYADQEVSGSVALGKVLTLKGSLEPEIQSVKVTSDPPGATVVEENSIIGTTPFEIVKKTGILLKYTFRLKGHKEVEITKTVAPGKTSVISVDLIPILEPENINAYYKLAGDGDAEAMWKIGRMYDEGRGVGVDPIKAVEWYEKSAEHQSPDGLFLLGLSQELGEGTSIDRQKAVLSYKSAAHLGHEEAIERLEMLHGFSDDGGDVTAQQAYLDYLRKLRDEQFQEMPQSPMDSESENE